MVLFIGVRGVDFDFLLWVLSCYSP